MKWFKNPRTMEELRKQYRQLMKENHPDIGGTEEAAKEINNEYDMLFAVLSRQGAAQEQKESQDTAEENEEFKAVIARLVNVNADIEIIGSWIWIHGGYEYRELLKSIGFRFAPRKKAWCWHFGEYRRHHKEEVSLDEIREKYGSKTVSNRKEQERFAY